MTANPVRVLVIDDSRADWVLIRELFRQLDPDGYRLEWVDTVDGAMDVLHRHVHDVCLLDRHLGVEDGLELLERATELHHSLPIVLLTGAADSEVEHRALAAGAADFLVKNTLDPMLLERTVRHAIERAHARTAIEDRDAALRAVFEASHDGMILTDDQGKCVDANRTASQLLGSTAALPPELLTLIPPRSRRSDPGLLQLQSATTREPRFYDVGVTPDAQPGRHLVVLRDVTDRHQADQVRRRLGAVLEALHDGVEGWTPDGRVEWWTPSAERLFGWTAAEAVGRQGRQLHAPDGPDVTALGPRLAEGHVLRDLEHVLHRKDGTRFTAAVTLVPTVRDGVLIGVSVVTRDVSERKRLQAQLAVADRMASVGTLAAGVAHEINNPLAAMLVNIDCLAELAAALPDPTGAAMAAPLADVQAAGERIRAITKDLRMFSRTPEVTLTAVDVCQVIEGAVRMAWNEIRHRALLVRERCEAPLVLGHEGRLGQVFLNLLVNAAQAIPEGHADEHRITVRSSTDPDGNARVEVSDTGCGIPAAVLPHVFDPFVTTKPVGIGTGLGLSICHRIVHDHGGQISVRSEVGRGTTFTVVLPGSAHPPTPRPVEAPVAPTRPARRGKVLVIDDEEMVGRAVARLLRDHDVTVQTDPRAALGLLLSGGSWDVVLCDLMMPVLTGMELYARVARVAPDLARRFVFASGGTFTEGARSFLAEVENPRLDKPFEPALLRRLVASRIASSDGPPVGR